MDVTSLPDEEIQRRSDYFARMLTPERLGRIEQVLTERTRYLTVVLEDIFQPHNAGAVLRSCDAFGVQDVHVIENNNTFTSNSGVALGTSQWLTVQRYREKENNTREAVQSLKDQGYRIIATSPHAEDTDLERLDVSSGKMALLFGTELTGLSPLALDLADEYVKIPMFGFVESLNISVSCAVSLHHLVHEIRSREIDYALGEREKAALQLKWMRQSIRNPHIHDEILDQHSLK
jgi:tRNA (guanosine-2'-O-)-methyltransferase